MYSVAYLAEKLLHRCKHPGSNRNEYPAVVFHSCINSTVAALIRFLAVSATTETTSQKLTKSKFQCSQDVVS